MKKATIPAGDPYEELAKAIIVQAAEDYRNALMLLKKNARIIKGNRDKKDCESFFRSRWFGELTGVDGEFLIKKLREEAE